MKFLKTIYLTITAYMLCVLQSYLSMRHYAKELSAYCLKCPFYQEILVVSLLMVFIFPIVQVLKVLNWNIQLKNVISAMLFFLLLYTVNSNIFDARVASWSSYAHSDVLISVFFASYPYLLTSLLLFWLLLQKLKPF